MYHNSYTIFDDHVTLDLMINAWAMNPLLLIVISLLSLATTTIKFEAAYS